MGSAFYETNGILKGSDAELSAFKDVLSKHTGKRERVWFIDCAFEKQNGNELSFSASGPYGGFDSLSEVPIFTEMAEAAPGAFFSIEVTGNTDFTEDEMVCKLSGGKLSIETRTVNSDDADRAYLEYIIGKMPYDKYIKIYGIKPETLEEESYEDYINDLIFGVDCENNPFEMGYEEFLQAIELQGAQTALTEETYNEAAARVRELGIMSSVAFGENNDCSVCEKREYDPVARRWIDE